jgi:hypothetical protein
MTLPWVSRSQYNAVLAAKDDMIAVLKAQIMALDQRLSTPISVSVNLPEGFAVQMPAVVSRRPKPRHDQDASHPAVAKEVDWASVNEHDNEAIARIAAQELGGPVPAHVLARTVNQIKMNIRTAKADKLRRSLTEGKVGTQSRPAPLTEDDAIEQGSAYVPAEIRKLVESAERG